LEVEPVLAEGGGVDGEEEGAGIVRGAGGVEDEEGLSGGGVDAGVVLEVLEELGAEGEFFGLRGKGGVAVGVAHRYGLLLPGWHVGRPG
jgi:hypothetical protein